VVGDRPHILTIGSPDHDVVDAVEAGRLPRDPVEDVLDVGRPVADDAQNLRGGRLLLKGLGEGTIAARGSLAQRRVLRLQLRDPRVEIVRHHVHHPTMGPLHPHGPGRTAPLRNGARIARFPEAVL
jgi:hypothetical protein